LTDPLSDQKPPSRWFWIVIILLLFAILLAWLLLPLAEVDQGAPPEQLPPSSEWIQANPTEPSVPVELPKTPMTNVPAETAAPAEDASGE